MAGDKFNLFAYAWWISNNTPAAPANPLSDLLSVISSSASAISGGHLTASDIGSSLELGNAASSFLNGQSYLSYRPKAYLNWVLLDERFNLVSSCSGFEQVAGRDTSKTFSYSNLPVTKNGYLYIYVSNVTNNINVYFDQLTVTHIRGPLLEENHYYPFGLTMAGISSKALGFGGSENKKKYNGIDLESKEFSDGSGLEVYDAQLRVLDGQVGRWWQIDPEIENMEMWSPYVSNYDNPIRYSDPLGDEGQDCCGGLLKVLDDLLINASGVVGGMINTLSFGIFSSDPLGFSSKLDEEKQEQFDRAIFVGKFGPVVAGFRSPAKTAPVELAPVGPVKPVPVTITTATKPIVVRSSTGQQRSASDEKLIKEAKEAKAKEEAAKQRQQNRQAATTQGITKLEIAIKKLKEVTPIQKKGRLKKTIMKRQMPEELGNNKPQRIKRKHKPNHSSYD
jgi:RHS repeat-associated protein